MIVNFLFPRRDRINTCTLFSGSPTDHSPVLNLSKSGGGSAGSLGDADHSGSEADGPDVPPSPRSPRSAAEDEDDDNISDPEDEDDKDQGKHPIDRSPFDLDPPNLTALTAQIGIPVTDGERIRWRAPVGFKRPADDESDLGLSISILIWK